MEDLIPELNKLSHQNNIISGKLKTLTNRLAQMIDKVQSSTQKKRKQTDANEAIKISTLLLADNIWRSNLINNSNEVLKQNLATIQQTLLSSALPHADNACKPFLEVKDESQQDIQKENNGKSSDDEIKSASLINSDKEESEEYITHIEYILMADESTNTSSDENSSEISEIIDDADDLKVSSISSANESITYSAADVSTIIKYIFTKGDSEIDAQFEAIIKLSDTEESEVFIPEDIKESVEDSNVYIKYVYALDDIAKQTDTHFEDTVEMEESEESNITIKSDVLSSEDMKVKHIFTTSEDSCLEDVKDAVKSSILEDSNVNIKYVYTLNDTKEQTYDKFEDEVKIKELEESNIIIKSDTSSLEDINVRYIFIFLEESWVENVKEAVKSLVLEEINIKIKYIYTLDDTEEQTYAQFEDEAKMEESEESNIVTKSDVLSSENIKIKHIFTSSEDSCVEDIKNAVKSSLDDVVEQIDDKFKDAVKPLDSEESNIATKSVVLSSEDMKVKHVFFASEDSFVEDVKDAVKSLILEESNVNIKYVYTLDNVEKQIDTLLEDEVKMEESEESNIATESDVLSSEEIDMKYVLNISEDSSMEDVKEEVKLSSSEDSNVNIEYVYAKDNSEMHIDDEYEDVIELNIEFVDVIEEPENGLNIEDIHEVHDDYHTSVKFIDDDKSSYHSCGCEPLDDCDAVDHLHKCIKKICSCKDAADQSGTKCSDYLLLSMKEVENFIIKFIFKLDLENIPSECDTESEMKIDIPESTHESEESNDNMKFVCNLKDLEASVITTSIDAVDVLTSDDINITYVLKIHVSNNDTKSEDEFKPICSEDSNVNVEHDLNNIPNNQIDQSECDTDFEQKTDNTVESTSECNESNDDDKTEYLFVFDENIYIPKPLCNNSNYGVVNVNVVNVVNVTREFNLDKWRLNISNYFSFQINALKADDSNLSSSEDSDVKYNFNYFSNDSNTSTSFTTEDEFEPLRSDDITTLKYIYNKDDSVINAQFDDTAETTDSEESNLAIKSDVLCSEDIKVKYVYTFSEESWGEDVEDTIESSSFNEDSDFNIKYIYTLDDAVEQTDTQFEDEAKMEESEDANIVTESDVLSAEDINVQYIFTFSEDSCIEDVNEEVKSLILDESDFNIKYVYTLEQSEVEVKIEEFEESDITIKSDTSCSEDINVQYIFTFSEDSCIEDVNEEVKSLILDESDFNIKYVYTLEQSEVEVKIEESEESDITIKSDTSCSEDINVRYIFIFLEESWIENVMEAVKSLVLEEIDVKIKYIYTLDDTVEQTDAQFEDEVKMEESEESNIVTESDVLSAEDINVQYIFTLSEDSCIEDVNEAVKSLILEESDLNIKYVYTLDQSENEVKIEELEESDITIKFDTSCSEDINVRYIFIFLEESWIENVKEAVKSLVLDEINVKIKYIYTLDDTVEQTDAQFEDEIKMEELEESNILTESDVLSAEDIKVQYIFTFSEDSCIEDFNEAVKSLILEESNVNIKYVYTLDDTGVQTEAQLEDAIKPSVTEESNIVTKSVVLSSEDIKVKHIFTISEDSCVDDVKDAIKSSILEDSTINIEYVYTLDDTVEQTYAQSEDEVKIEEFEESNITIKSDTSSSEDINVRYIFILLEERWVGDVKEAVKSLVLEEINVKIKYIYTLDDTVEQTYDQSEDEIKIEELEESNITIKSDTAVKSFILEDSNVNIKCIYTLDDTVEQTYAQLEDEIKIEELEESNITTKSDMSSSAEDINIKYIITFPEDNSKEIVATKSDALDMLSSSHVELTAPSNDEQILSDVFGQLINDVISDALMQITISEHLKHSVSLDESTHDELATVEISSEHHQSSDLKQNELLDDTIPIYEQDYQSVIDDIIEEAELKVNISNTMLSELQDIEEDKRLPSSKSTNFIASNPVTMNICDIHKERILRIIQTIESNHHRLNVTTPEFIRELFANRRNLNSITPINF